MVPRLRFLVALVTTLALQVSVLAVLEQPSGAAAAAVSLVRKLEHTYGGFDDRSTHEAFSGTAVGDITGDGKPEIVAGGMDGVVRGWDAATGAKVFDHWVAGAAIHATPALIDLDGNGVLDVLTASLSGDVVGVRADGRRIFHVRDRTDMPRSGVFGTPTAADLDRDGQLEVIATSWDHHIHAWNLDGSYVPGFPRFVYDTLWSSPSVADIDGDGWLEIVFGGDMDAYPGAPYPAGGLVWAVRHDAKDQPGFPRSLPGQVIWSTPALEDITGDGKLDIVVGTGLNWPNKGRRVHALQANGTDVPGWPVSTGGRVMGSPALGDLNGDGKTDVATLSDDGRVNVHDRHGNLLWSRCAISDTSACRTDYGVHGQVSIADVDNDGTLEVVAAAEHWLRILNGPNGAEETAFAMPNVWAPASAPTISQVSGEAWITLNTTVNVTSGSPGVGDKQTVWVWKTGKPLGAAPWPTFKKNMRRTGTMFDDVPPTAAMGALAASQGTTSFPVTWSGSDAGGSGLNGFEVHVRAGGGAWVKWFGRITSTSRTFYGIAGEVYDFRVRARDKAGNVSPWSAIRSTAVGAGASSPMPFHSFYSLNSTGDVGELSSPPTKTFAFPPNLGRGIALAPDGKGGYVLDGWGGVHPIGNAPPVKGSSYWKGWDIARGIALNPDGRSGYKVDAYGGLHTVGAAKGVKTAGYWPGRNLTRDIVLLPTSTKDDPGGYVLDAYGGLHPFGHAPAMAGGHRRWPGWSVARAFALNPDGPGGWILDAWGGLHSVGGAPKLRSPGYWVGWDITRDLVAVSGTSGYVLDGFGAVHGYGGAPAPHHGAYWGRDVARQVAIAPR